MFPSSVVKTRDWIAIAVALALPTLVTLVYFRWLQDSQSNWQQIAFGIGKFLQFGFPILFVWKYYPDKIRWAFLKSPTAAHELTDIVSPTKYIWYGIAFGCLVASAMLTVYFTLVPTEIATNLKTLVSQRVVSLGIDTAWKYLGLAVFYTICHSFLEEYYWRWFVYDLLQRLAPNWFANFLSSVGFMAHHVIVLGHFIGWTSPLTYVLSLSIAVGGSFWAWLFQQERRLRSNWISHAIVDAAIFGFGYWLIR